MSGASLGLGPSLASTATHAACPELSAWIAAATATPGKTIAAREQQDLIERKSRDEAASTVFSAYRAGKLNAAELEACLKDIPGKSDFFNTLQSIAFDETLELFKKAAHQLTIAKVLEQLNARSRDGNIPFFRLIARPEENDASPYKAGFHRAVGSIYLDISRVASDEWPLIWMHEVLHSLDDAIFDASSYFSDEARVKTLAEKARRMPDLAQWSAMDRSALDAWIQAGLHRGLWAEYRAWIVSFRVYREAVDADLFQKIAWVEELLGQIPAGQSLESGLYAILDRRSKDPTRGLFSLPAIQAALVEQRKRASANPALIPMPGKLGALGRPKPGRL